jgi:alpha-glucosidase
VLFNERRGDTTWAHQLASAAILTSPLLTYGAHPGTLLESPALPVIRSLPAIWDETIVLPISAIGEIAAFARRSGEAWFLAILNGPAARTVEMPLLFLGEGAYQAFLVRDCREDAAALSLEETRVGRGETITVDLAEGGGFIGRFAR